MPSTSRCVNLRSQNDITEIDDTDRTLLAALQQDGGRTRLLLVGSHGGLLPCHAWEGNAGLVVRLAG